MNKYFIEYKDECGFGCGYDIEAQNEHLAVMKLVEILTKEDSYMSQLISVTQNKYED